MFNRFYRQEIHSVMVGIFDPACELLWLWGVGGGGVLNCVVDRNSTGVLHSVSD